MINFTVQYHKEDYRNNFQSYQGKILDKVMVGRTHSNSTGAVAGWPVTQYMIQSEEGDIHMVNPSDIKKIIKNDGQI